MHTSQDTIGPPDSTEELLLVHTSKSNQVMAATQSQEKKLTILRLVALDNLGSIISILWLSTYLRLSMESCVAFFLAMDFHSKRDRI